MAKRGLNRRIRGPAAVPVTAEEAGAGSAGNPVRRRIWTGAGTPEVETLLGWIGAGTLEGASRRAWIVAETREVETPLGWIGAETPDAASSLTSEAAAQKVPGGAIHHAWIAADRNLLWS